jgi:hypothetical protein
MASAESVIKYLQGFPPDTEVLIAGTSVNHNEKIRSFHITTGADGVPLTPIVLSAHMYTRNEIG